MVTITLLKDIESRIGLLAVKEGFRGKNIGGKLLQAAEMYAIQSGRSSIEVTTQTNNIAACNFYEKNGFKLKKRNGYIVFG